MEQGKDVVVRDMKIDLNPAHIKKYLCPTATEAEIFMFLQLCKHQNLNPWIREAYLIKYGNQKATIVTGKETFTKRAANNPRYGGHRAWTDGKVPNLKGIADVYVRGYTVPIHVEVDYEEYVGKKSDGTVNRMWKEKPKTMLRKVALVQALREAFPNDFGGMYSPEEINTIEADKLPTEEIKITEAPQPIDAEYPPQDDDDKPTHTVRHGKAPNVYDVIRYDGIIYHVDISEEKPYCSCPARKECKHIKMVNEHIVQNKPSKPLSQASPTPSTNNGGNGKDSPAPPDKLDLLAKTIAGKVIGVEVKAAKEDLPEGLKNWQLAELLNYLLGLKSEIEAEVWISKLASVCQGDKP